MTSTVYWCCASSIIVVITILPTIPHRNSNSIIDIGIVILWNTTTSSSSSSIILGIAFSSSFSSFVPIKSEWCLPRPPYWSLLSMWTGYYSFLFPRIENNYSVFNILITQDNVGGGWNR